MGITDAADEPPDLKYVAEIQAVDYALDLAVIKVTTDLNGQKVTQQFPFVQVGDSQSSGSGSQRALSLVAFLQHVPSGGVGPMLASAEALPVPCSA